jgi:hypothetical protein
LLKKKELFWAIKISPFRGYFLDPFGSPASMGIPEAVLISSLKKSHRWDASLKSQK